MGSLVSSIPKLGFGLMRLPKLDNGKIDIEQVKEMVDLFMEAGLRYFDTAYVYDNGDSELAACKALVERYPRESYLLATKLCAWLPGATEENVKQQLFTSLERTGAGYFDFYLLHALQRANYRKYDEFGIWDFVQEQKEKGIIKNWGFSFHADPELLDELLSAHPEADFVQLQINYADWENPGVAAKKNWEICRSHGKPVTIMEPIKGGILADPIQSVKAVFDEADASVSYASWAIRYAASLDNIVTVLSGMSSLEQVRDNISYMRNFRPLDAGELEVIAKARKALDEDRSIPCTSCHYCTGGCPQSIPIPEIFTVFNRKKGSPEFRTLREYTIVTTGKGKAGDCVRCGQCEDACPQQISIIDRLKECADCFKV